MAVLVDPPRWPAHGTQFGHLVSDTSLDELHAFARAAGLPARAFDHDHYDVPVARYADLVAQGALEVSSTELLRRLVAGGLRVRPGDRTPRRAAAREALPAAWQRLGLPGRLDREQPGVGWSQPVTDGLGDEALGPRPVGEADRHERVTGGIPVAGDEAQLSPPVQPEPADPREQGLAQIVPPRRDLTENERLHGAQPLRKV